MYKSIKEQLIGKTVLKIAMDKDYLVFYTDAGPVAFTVSEACCSTSVFYDFYGVKNLLQNGPITNVEKVDLHPDLTKDVNEPNNSEGETKVYGYRITTEDHMLYGDVTSVFSFRNYSNGYYGGSLESIELESIPPGLPQITDDITEIKYE